MLAKLLALISNEGIFKTTELARRLDTSPELVEQAIETLVQHGYLRAVESCGEAKCGSCAVSKGCNAPKARLGLRRKL
jgi:DNA-binding IscR family transcriptional regulator